MAHRGFTNKPCPVCGSVGLRPTNKVCGECQAVYEDGKRLQDAFKASGNKILVLHSNTFHWISRPYVMCGGMMASRLTERLTKAWSALANIIAREPGVLEKWTPERERIEYLVTNKDGLWGVRNDFGSYPQAEDVRLVDKDLREALNNYDTFVRLSLEYCYVRGRLEGLNLLQQLNAGTESPSDFSDTEEKLEATITRIKKDLEAQP